MEFDAELMCNTVLVLFFMVLSIQDIRCGSVNGIMMAAFLLVGVFLGFVALKIPLSDMFIALIPGASLLIASYLFGNAVGIGDALALLLVGTMNGFIETFTVFCTALALSLVPAIFLFIKGKNGKKTMPFLPFLCIGTIIMLMGKAG